MGFAVTLVGLLAMATVLSFMGRFAWWMDLFSHFRVHYTVGAVGVIIIALWARLRSITVLAGLIGLINGAGWAQLWISPNVNGGEATIHTLVFNVNSDGDIPAVKALLARSQEVDVVGLLEITHQWLPALDEALSPWPYRIVHPRSDNFGLLLASRWPLKGRVTDPVNVGLPVIVATLKPKKAPAFGFILVHALPPYNAESTAIRNRMIRALTEIRGLPADRIIAGDFNATPWSVGLRPFFTQGFRWLGQGHGAKVTWPDGLGPLGIYIDHAFVGGDLTPVSFDVLDSAGSDHFPLRFTVGRSPPVRHP